MAHRAAIGPPSLIVVLPGNLGDGDLDCYGNRAHPTPNLGRPAAGGMRPTSYHRTGGMCDPLCASFVTGCHPCRVRLCVNTAGWPVLAPMGATSLNSVEVTTARAVRQRLATRR